MLNRVETPERGVAVLDAEFNVRAANQRAAEFFGVELGKLVGQPLPKVFKKRAEADAIVEEVLELPETVIHRYSAPFYDAAGKPAGRVEIYSDITARRELEKEIIDRNRELTDLNERLREAQEQLIQSERLRALGEMAAGIAHDINNVLGIILGNVQIAKRKIESDYAAVRCIEAIELAANDAAETVRRLREIGKPVDRSSYSVVDLSDAAREILRAAVPAWLEGEAVKTDRIKITSDFEPGCLVLGNAAELRQALANVLLNAAQSIENEGSIVVRTARSGECVEAAVTDDGCGMSHETQKRLFDPFFTTRGAGGSGLGMSMVDAIVMRHQGKVLVESGEGKGTTVTLRFPYAGQDGSK